MRVRMGSGGGLSEECGLVWWLGSFFIVFDFGVLANLLC